MDWKLMGSTFLLVFLAELGDKTQLTALAASSGSKSPLSVFIGASVALVLSTLIAVLVGSLLTRFLPERYLKLAAGLLFLIFGTILIIRNIAPSSEELEETTAQIQPGAFTTIVLKAAHQFESAAHSEYSELADRVEDLELKDLILELAQEEKEHEAELMGIEPGEEETVTTGVLITVPETKLNTGETTDRQSILEYLINRESEEVKFYRLLSESVKLPGLKQAFLRLSESERSHLARLVDFRDKTA